MTPQQKELDRIKKLLAKANDEATTQEEAAAFAAKAAELATRANLDLSEIDWETRKTEKPIGRFRFYPQDYELKVSKSRVKWMEDLCSAVCRANGVKLILMGGNTYDLVGREGGIEIAAYLCAYLCRFALDMSWRDYGVEYRRAQALGDVTLARGFRQSWLTGFSRTVIRRLRELKEQLMVEYAQSTALVRLTSDYDEATEWMHVNMDTHKSTALSGYRATHSGGYSSGTRAGGQVDVTGRATKAGGENKKIR